MLLRREVGVDDVPLAEIVVTYVAQLAEQSRVDPDTAGEFLVLIAGLMEIKARELLAIDADLEIEDPAAVVAQEEMLERLVRYATFKQAAGWLGERADRERWWRVASRPPRRAPGVYDGPVLDPALLRRSMQVLLSQPDVDVRHLVGRHASVHEMTGRLLGVLRQRREFRFEEAVDGLSRLDQAVAFVAALELCKAGHVELVQDARFGPITVVRTDQVDRPADAARPDVAQSGDMGVQTA